MHDEPVRERERFFLVGGVVCREIPLVGVDGVRVRVARHGSEHDRVSESEHDRVSESEKKCIRVARSYGC